MLQAAGELKKLAIIPVSLASYDGRLVDESEGGRLACSIEIAPLKAIDLRADRAAGYSAATNDDYPMSWRLLRSPVSRLPDRTSDRGGQRGSNTRLRAFKERYVYAVRSGQ
jgi:hypothetical protein